MCTIYFKDTTNTAWLGSIDDFGDITSTKQTGVKLAHYTSPVMVDVVDGTTWAVNIDTFGDFVLQPGKGQFPLDYLIMTNSSGKPYKVFVSRGGLQTQLMTTRLLDEIPTPLDVTMSRWPEGFNGLICPNCNNASVTAQADFSLWCCSCNTFVPPEDTIIEVALSE